MNYPIKSLLFLVGDDEFADSPAGVNRALFADPSAKWERLDIPETGAVIAEINPNVQYARMGTRMLAAVRFTRPDKTAFIQPFYRSSGRATPELSKAGDWWPCSGLYTAAYCKWANHPADTEGYIGKHQRLYGPDGAAHPKDIWVAHHKERERVHPAYQVVCNYLQAAIPVK